MILDFEMDENGRYLLAGQVERSSKRHMYKVGRDRDRDRNLLKF